MLRKVIVKKLTQKCFFIVFFKSEIKFKFTERMSSSSSLSSQSKSKFDDKDKKNILVGCSGSVAAVKLPIIVKKLLECECFNVKVVSTEHARHFFTPDELYGVELITDADEWRSWNKREDPVIHIALSKWADLFVISPLDANTLSKIAFGLCDNLLTCVARAWDMSKPLLFCPAMNTKMYEHPITAIQISTLTNWGYIEIPVITKILICGDKGVGAMAEVNTIVENILAHTKETLD